MRSFRRPAIRGILAFIAAVAVLLAAALTPLGLVAEGQTAGPVPANPTANCGPVSGPVTAKAGFALSVPCPGGGALGVSAPAGALGAGGSINIVQVGDVLGAQSACDGVSQLPILAAQHFSSSWAGPGQATSLTTAKPVTIQLPIAPALLAQAGGSPSRLLVLQVLPDGSVVPVPSAISADGTTARFQTTTLGDFYVAALPAATPSSYTGTIGQANAQNHTFVLSSASGTVTVQSADRQGGTTISRANGAPASFNDVGLATSAQVSGVPVRAACAGVATVVAKTILLNTVGGASAQLPNQLPHTGLGGAASR